MRRTLMSSASPFRTDPVAFDSLIESLDRALKPVQFLGFWTAIVAPFVILALIADNTAQSSPALLAGLLTLNVVGIVLGRGYNT
jgi:hypothetical protein